MPRHANARFILLGAASILVGCGSIGADASSAKSPVQQENAVAGSATEKIDAYAVNTSQASVQSLHGLTLLPERSGTEALQRTVSVPAGKPAMALDGALSNIARLYGRQTAFGVALDFEYPGYNG